MTTRRHAAVPGILWGRASLTLSQVGAPSRLIPSATERVRGPAAFREVVHLTPPQRWRDGCVNCVDLVLLTDSSGSMYGPWGDPSGIRRAAALSVVALLARGATSRQEGPRVGVVHFGSDAPLELVLPLTSVGDRRIIEHALRLPASLGGTNVAAALARGREILSDDAHRLPLVVVITDGIEVVGDEVARELARLPRGAAHVVLVDHGHGCTIELETLWRRLPLGSFERLNVLDTDQLSWQVADVVARAVGLSLPPLNSRHNIPPTRR